MADDCKHDKETLRYTEHCGKCGRISDNRGPHPDTEALKKAAEFMISEGDCPDFVDSKYSWCDVDEHGECTPRLIGSPVECWMRLFRGEK